MKTLRRFLPTLLLTVILLAPLSTHAATVWTYGLFAGAANGHEQIETANYIANSLASFGYLGSMYARSSYRNSYIQLVSSGGSYFSLDGANLGSRITIVGKQDWMGVATNICASIGSGWLEGNIVNDSDCNYYTAWSRSTKTLGINTPIGSCGTATSVATNSAPTSNLCSAGTASTPILACYFYDGENETYGACGGNINETATWTWSCGSASCSAPYVAASAPPPPSSAAPTVTLSATSPIASGGLSALTWTTTNANYGCYALMPWPGVTPEVCEYDDYYEEYVCTGGYAYLPAQSSLSAPVIASPTTNTTYTLTCSGPGGAAAGTRTVSVCAAGQTVVNGVCTTPAVPSQPKITVPAQCCSPTPGTCPALPTATLSANPGIIDQGQSATLTWSSTNATNCTGTGFTAGGASGSRSTGAINTPGPANYQVVCQGPGGTSLPAFATVEVLAPDASISASPARVSPGGSSSISWSASGVQSCVVTGPAGTLASGAANGSHVFTTGSPRSVAVTTQSTYTITCQTLSAPVSESVTVNVLAGFQEF